MKNFLLRFSLERFLSPLFCFLLKKSLFVTPDAFFCFGIGISYTRKCSGEVVVRFKEKSNQQRGQSFSSRIDALAKKKNLKKVKASEEHGVAVFQQDGKVPKKFEKRSHGRCRNRKCTAKLHLPSNSTIKILEYWE